MSAKKPYEIVPGVWGMGSEYVNWYLVKDDDGLTAVDAGLPAYAGSLEADLAAVGHGPEDIAALVLTHSDADHTGLAPALQAAGAQVWIHEGDEDTLRRPRPKGGEAAPAKALPHLINPRIWPLIFHMVRSGGARPPKVKGARTFADGEAIDVPGAPRAVATPGHTPGHAAIHFERQGVLFVGDALCTWNPASGRRGPQAMPKPMNVDTAECLRSLDALEPLRAELVLAGHGEPFRGTPASAVAQAREYNRS